MTERDRKQTIDKQRQREKKCKNVEIQLKEKEDRKLEDKIQKHNKERRRGIKGRRVKKTQKEIERREIKGRSVKKTQKE